MVFLQTTKKEFQESFTYQTMHAGKSANSHHVSLETYFKELIEFCAVLSYNFKSKDNEACIIFKVV